MKPFRMSLLVVALLTGSDGGTSDAVSPRMGDSTQLPTRADAGAADAQARNGAQVQPGPPAEPGSATSVRAIRVSGQALQPWIYGQGTARAVRREYLTFPSAGRIAWVDPKLKVGDRVKKGQLIAYQQPDRPQAELANAQAGVSGARTDLAVAKASLREAVANLELAKETFRRYEILLAKRSASQQEYDEAEARLASARAAKDKAGAQIAAIDAKSRASAAQLSQAQVTVSESRLVSPINGVLARLNIEQGYYFSPQTVQSTSEQGALSTIPAFVIDPSAHEITVDLPAYRIGDVSVGTTVLVSSQDPTGRAQSNQAGAAANALPPTNASIEGRVYSITPSIDPAKRTFQVKSRTTTAEGRLYDGAFVSMWIAGEKAAAPAPVVPFDALRYSDGKPFVFVVDPATQRVARRQVTLGAQGRDTQAIDSGLQPGEWVVTEGRSALNDGDRVRLLDETPPAAPPASEVRQ